MSRRSRTGPGVPSPAGSMSPAAPPGVGALGCTNSVVPISTGAGPTHMSPTLGPPGPPGPPAPAPPLPPAPPSPPLHPGLEPEIAPPEAPPSPPQPPHQARNAVRAIVARIVRVEDHVGDEDVSQPIVPQPHRPFVQLDHRTRVVVVPLASLQRKPPRTSTSPRGTTKASL